MAAVLEKIKITPLSAACGAEITGVDLTQELSAPTVAAIRQAWHDHIVLVFRGQEVTEEQQLRFASYFGSLGRRKEAMFREELQSRNQGTKQVNPNILLVSNIKEKGEPIGAFGEGEMWFHIDSGYAEKPYNYTFLYALELPSTGGNTQFSNMYKAYDALPADLKIRLAGKKALHIHEYERSAKVELRDDLSKSAHFFHPVFSTHAETGRKSLFVDRLMTARLEGFPKEENESLLEQLYEIGERPEFIYEHKWQLGDFVMWDNRCAIHARTWFPPEERRLLRRCAIEGAPIHE
jgi:taurine dioxygenase